MPNLCIIPARVLTMPEVEETDLRVLLAIARHADRYGENVWASAQTLSTVAGVSRRSFFRSAAKLEGLGVVRRTRRWKDTGEPDTSMYAVLLDDPVGGSDTAMALPSDTALTPRSATAMAGRSDTAMAHKRPHERPPERDSSPAREKLIADHHQAAYDTLQRHNPQGRAAVDFELVLVAEGGERPGFGPVAPEGWARVGEALHQIVAAGRALTPRSLRTFLDGLDPRPAPAKPAGAAVPTAPSRWAAIVDAPDPFADLPL